WRSGTESPRLCPLMSLSDEVGYLLEYTDWDRAQWEQWFRAQDRSAFAVALGANAYGPFKSVGELVRHIFSAEQRYVDRVRGRPVTDAKEPSDDVDALFDLGRRTRANMRQLLREFPADR